MLLNLLATLCWLVIIGPFSYWLIKKSPLFAAGKGKVVKKKAVVSAWLGILLSYIILHLAPLNIDFVLLAMALVVWGGIFHRHGYLLPAKNYLVILLGMSLVTGVFSLTISVLNHAAEPIQLFGFLPSSPYVWRDPDSQAPILTINPGRDYSIIEDRGGREIKVDYQRNAFLQGLMESLGGAPDVMEISISRPGDTDYYMELSPQDYINHRHEAFGYVDTYSQERIGSTTFTRFTENGTPESSLYVYGSGYVLTVDTVDAREQVPNSTINAILATVQLKQ